MLNSVSKVAIFISDDVVCNISNVIWIGIHLFYLKCNCNCCVYRYCNVVHVGHIDYRRHNLWFMILCNNLCWIIGQVGHFYCRRRNICKLWNGIWFGINIFNLIWNWKHCIVKSCKIVQVGHHYCRQRNNCGLSNWIWFGINSFHGNWNCNPSIDICGIIGQVGYFYCRRRNIC
jgi:hypothetical protein